MAEESFILNLVGRLDEAQTKKNIQGSLDTVGKSVDVKNKTPKVTIFDKTQLDSEGKQYLASVENIKQQIIQAFNVKEGQDVTIQKIFDDNGNITKFKANITEAGKTLQSLYYESAKFTDETNGFILKKRTDNTEIIEAKKLNDELRQRTTLLNQVADIKATALSKLDPTTDAEQISKVNQSYDQLVNKINNFDMSNSTQTLKQACAQDISNLKSLSKVAQETKQSIEGVAPNNKTWGATNYSSVDDFIRDYSTKMNGMVVTPTIKYHLDDNSNIVGFTAEVKTAEGAVQQLRYQIAECEQEEIGLEQAAETYWKFVSATVKDDVYEKQAKSITNMEDKLAKFKTQVNDGVTFKFNTDELNSKIAKLENVVSMLRNNVGNNSDIRMSAVERILNATIETANATEKAEKKKQAESDKTTAKLQKQATQLETNRALIKSWLETKVNPDSASFVGNSEKLDEVMAKLQEVIKIRAELSAKNKNQEILSEKDIGRLTVALTELRLLFSEAKKASGKSLERDESYSKLAQNIRVATSALDANIAKWKNMGVYSGKFKADVESLRSELTATKEVTTATGEVTERYLVSSSNELDIIKAKMREYNNIALETQRSQVGSNAKDLESQRKYVELATESLQRYKREISDSNAKNPLKTDDLQKALNIIDYVSARLEHIKNQNLKGNIVDTKTINQFEIELAKAKNEIDGFYDNQRKLKIDNDTLNSIELYKEKLNTLEQKYESLISNSSSFKTIFDSVKDGLNNISTPEELKNWEQEFKLMQEGAKQTKMSLDGAFKDDQLTQKLAILKQQLNIFEQSNPRGANIYAQQFENLRKGIESATTSQDLRTLQNQFRSLKLQIKEAGVEGLTFGQRIQNAMKKFMQWTGVTSVVMYTVRVLRELIQNVKDLDASMVSLKKVTNETDTTYKQMFSDAIDKAKELNTSVTNIIDSTAEFSKLGFAPDVASQLAEIATVYANVGNDMPIYYSNVI